MKNSYTDIMKQINPAFKEQRKSRVPRFFDELSSDQRLEDPEKAF